MKKNPNVDRVVFAALKSVSMKNLPERLFVTALESAAASQDIVLTPKQMTQAQRVFREGLFKIGFSKTVGL